jgi:O-antigen ligase
MAQQRLPFRSSRPLNFSPAAMGMILILCLALGLGQALLITLNPLIGLAGIAAVALIMLFLMRPELALPLYILVAAPTIALSASSSGILSRLYIGDLLFALLVGIWLLRELLLDSKERLAKIEIRILIPLVCLVIIGFISIIYSHLHPDPHVTYAFVHSDVPLLLVNLVEIFLLISLPLCIVIAPTMIRTLSNARRVIGAYLLVGLPYALGTIFAGPLHLYSTEVILGDQRPEVFGLTSSNLGILNVLFACLALGQTLYARKDSTRMGFGLLTSIYTAGVIMSLGRESWIGLLLAVWVITYFRFKNLPALLLPVIILPFVFLFFPSVINFFDPTKVYGADRINIWQDAITIWQRSPYLGVGAGNFQFFDIAYGIEVAGVAHNQFLEVLAEMGVQGLACLLLAILMIGRIALKRFKSAVSDIGKAVALAYLGYFAALLFAGFFTDSFLPSTAAAGGTGPFILGSYIWFFLGLVLSIPNWDKEAAISDIPVREDLSGVLSNAETTTYRH